MDPNKVAFLQNLVFDRQGYTDLIDHVAQISQKPIAIPYLYLVNVNAHNSGIKISEPEIEDFLKNIYHYWYDFLYKHIPNNKASPAYSETLQVRSDPTFLPEYIESNGGYFKFFTQDFNDLLPSKQLRVVKSQMFMLDEAGFLHINNFFNSDKQNKVRLYINLKAQHILPLANEVAKYCWDTNLPMHFKFSASDKRNDTFLIYTTYQLAPKFVDLLQGIHARNPEIFEGAESHSPLLATIKGAPYIGFGEEPEYKHSSFNTERVALFSMANIERKKAIRSLWDKSTKILAAEGQNLNIDEYLEHCIKQQLLDKTNEEINTVNKEKRKFPLELSEVETFLRGQNELVDHIKNGTFDKKVREIAQEYKGYLTEEFEPKANQTLDTLFYCTIKTANAAYAASHPNAQNEYKWRIPVSAKGLDKALIALSPDIECRYKQRLHTPDVQQPYLSANNISTSYPYLNLETERELAAENAQVLQ